MAPTYARLTQLFLNHQWWIANFDSITSYSQMSISCLLFTRRDSEYSHQHRLSIHLVTCWNILNVGKTSSNNFFPPPFLWLLIHVYDKNGLWSFHVRFLYAYVFQQSIFASAFQYLLNRHFCGVPKNTLQRIKAKSDQQIGVTFFSFFSCVNFGFLVSQRINLFYWKRHLP